MGSKGRRFCTVRNTRRGLYKPLIKHTQNFSTLLQLFLGLLSQLRTNHPRATAQGMNPHIGLEGGVWLDRWTPTPSTRELYTTASSAAGARWSPLGFASSVSGGGGARSSAEVELRHGETSFFGNQPRTSPSMPWGLRTEI